jgi:hypothetical protein
MTEDKQEHVIEADTERKARIEESLRQLQSDVDRHSDGMESAKKKVREHEFLLKDCLNGAMELRELEEMLLGQARQEWYSTDLSKGGKLPPSNRFVLVTVDCKKIDWANGGPPSREIFSCVACRMEAKRGDGWEWGVFSGGGDPVLRYSPDIVVRWTLIPLGHSGEGSCESD